MTRPLDLERLRAVVVAAHERCRFDGRPTEDEAHALAALADAFDPDTCLALLDLVAELEQDHKNMVDVLDEHWIGHEKIIATNRERDQAIAAIGPTERKLVEVEAKYERAADAAIANANENERLRTNYRLVCAAILGPCEDTGGELPGPYDLIAVIHELTKDQP